MSFSLDQLAIFLAAANEKSFSGTARKLSKAQSAVSTAIADLEVDLGVALFDRSARYPVLTEAGEALLSEVEAVLSHCDSLKERAYALTGGTEPRVSIAIEDAFPSSAVTQLLGKLHEKYPGVQLEIRKPNEAGLLETLLEGEVMLTIGCARAHYPSGIGFIRLGDVTLVNAVRRDHPLARVENVRFSHLRDHLQLFLSGQTKHLLTSEYLKSPRRWQVQSQAALLELLRGGLGWAIVPKRLIADDLRSGELIELKLQAYPYTDWRVGVDLVWRTDDKLGVVATWLKSEFSRTRIMA